ncbi:hypothetical protein V9T40_001698 [Parthenolecanium corni]|uniref:CBM21 domain-containing protein n=1 Tax=Parthenolecanium corni TaxID=536013 RepID=A0AAN9Y4M4_9HEMI
MSTVNIETRNAMATKQVVDYPSAYMNRQNGLIKSASTSSCSAHENALLKTLRASRYATNGKTNGFGDAEMAVSCNERLKLFVLQPFSHSEQNMLAADADALVVGAKGFYQSHGGAGRKKSFYSNSRHFSDCATASRTVASSHGGKSAGDNGAPRIDYSSHRNLDNVLVNKSNNSAIINFATVNAYHGNRGSSLRCPEAAVTTTPPSISSQCDISQMKMAVIDSLAAPLPKVAVSRSTPLNEMPKSSTIIQAPTLAHSQPASPNVTATSQAEARDTGSSNSSATNSVASSKDCTPEPSVNCFTDDEQEPVLEKKEKLCRRSSSLKMPKESTPNPAQKKIVRFADAMGLDLTDVRTFLDELPSVPRSAYNDLRACDFDLRNATPVADKLFGATAPTKPLVPMFKQPGISHNFVERIRDQNVCLEKAVVGSQPMCSIAGTVRVRNIDFHKSVYVRYTLDNWRTFGEVQAVYVPDSCDGFSDQFSFIIYLYELPTSQRLELAIRYHCSGSIYWDNNMGANYVFQTSSSPPVIPSYFACMPTSTDRCHSFY